MKISIITPAYNAAATLRDTLESVRDQTYPAVEHLLMDGGSTDDSYRIVQDFPHVEVYSEPDRGLYDAMNKGIARATGEIIGILNADDFYAIPWALEQIAELFKDPQIDAVYADLDYVDPQDTRRVIRQWRSDPFEPEAFLRGWMPPHPTFFVRRALYERYGAFNLDFRISADYELMLRFLYKHRVRAVYLPRVLVHMRAGGVSNANLRQRLRANREDRLAWKVNGLSPRFYTTLLKPLRKIRQWRK